MNYRHFNEIWFFVAWNYCEEAALDLDNVDVGIAVGFRLSFRIGVISAYGENWLRLMICWVPYLRLRLIVWCEMSLISIRAQPMIDAILETWIRGTLCEL